jgi:hypothetical protein
LPVTETVSCTTFRYETQISIGFGDPVHYHRAMIEPEQLAIHDFRNSESTCSSRPQRCL